MKKRLSYTKRWDWARLAFSLTIAILCVFGDAPVASIIFAFNAGHIAYAIIDDMINLKEEQRGYIKSLESLADTQRKVIASHRERILRQHNLIKYMETENEMLNASHPDQTFYPVEMWAKFTTDIAHLEDEYIKKRTFGDITENEGMIIQADIEALQKNINKLKAEWPKSINYN